MMRKISSWWVYEGEGDLAQLKELGNVLDSISLNCHPRELRKDFVQDCGKLGLQVLLLVNHHAGGYDSEQERSDTIEGLLAAVMEHGFDGIDLDYEFQPESSRESFSSFLRLLSQRLKREGKILSICVGFYPPMQDKASGYGFIDPVTVAATCDQVRVMCYDQNFAPGKNLDSLLDRIDCQSVGPVSSEPFVREALAYWRGFISSGKIVAGLPAYGNEYVASPGGGGRQVLVSRPSEGGNVDKSWIWYDKVNLYRYVDHEGVPRLFYATDVDSTRALLKAVSDCEVSCISFWHARLVEDGMWDAVIKWRAMVAPKS